MTRGARKFLFVAGAIGFLGVALAVYYGIQLCADVQIPGLAAPDSFDAKEARRKLDAFKTAISQSQIGYVRLTEAELNSHLGRSHDLSREEVTKLPANRWSVTKARIDLRGTNFAFYTWVAHPVGKWTFEVVWQRIGRATHGKDGWEAEVDSMKIGRVTLPDVLVPHAVRYLGGSDAAFEKEFKLLSEVPALELRFNEMTKRSELRLYTYAESNVVARATR